MLELVLAHPVLTAVFVTVYLVLGVLTGRSYCKRMLRENKERRGRWELYETDKSNAICTAAFFPLYWGHAAIQIAFFTGLPRDPDEERKKLQSRIDELEKELKMGFWK